MCILILGTDNMSYIIIQFLHNGKPKGDNIIIKKDNITEGTVENVEKKNIMTN